MQGQKSKTISFVLGAYETKKIWFWNLPTFTTPVFRLHNWKVENKKSEDLVGLEVKGGPKPIFKKKVIQKLFILI